MALNYDLRKCDPAFVWREDTAGESSTGNGRVMREIPWALVLTTMVVGLDEISEKNLSEWCWRVNLYSVIKGHLFSDEINEEFLRPFIGLNTNASKMTRKQFVKDVMLRLEREHDNRERRRIEEARKKTATV